jgi:hypothetical protein
MHKSPAAQGAQVMLPAFENWPGGQRISTNLVGQ